MSFIEPKTEKPRTHFRSGVCAGFILCLLCFIVWDAVTAPDLIYKHIHEGRRDTKSKAELVIYGAKFDMSYGEHSNYCSTIEPPQTLKDMLEAANDDFEGHDFFGQNYRAQKNPIKAIELKVWY